MCLPRRARQVGSGALLGWDGAGKVQLSVRRLQGMRKQVRLLPVRL